MEYSRTTKSGAKITYSKEPIDTKIDKVSKKYKSKSKLNKGKETKLLSKPKARGIAPISQSAY